MEHLSAPVTGGVAEILWLSDEPAPDGLNALAAEAVAVGPDVKAIVFLLDRDEPAADLLGRAGSESRCRIVVQIKVDARRAASLLEAGADAVCAPAELTDPRLLILRAAGAARLRIRAASQLRQIEHLQASIDTLPMPIFFKDCAGVYVGCNNAFLNFLGRSAKEVVGRTAADVMPPDLAPVYNAADRRVALNPEGVEIYETRAPFADGTRRDVLFHKSAHRSASGELLGIAGAMFDITDRKRLESQLSYAADHDPLTGLFNRRKFFALAERVLQSAHAQGQTLCALVLDLDWFKSVNDRHGHAAGDFVLQKVAEFALTHLRVDDILGRAGGEEFFALLPNFDEAAATRVADQLRAAIAHGEILFGGERLKITASIGVAEIGAGESIKNVLARADAALYRAKESGRNCVQGCAAA